VTGPTGILLSQGFTIDLVEDERYSVDLIATWSPDEKVFLYHTLAGLASFCQSVEKTVFFHGKNRTGKNSFCHYTLVQPLIFMTALLVL